MPLKGLESQGPPRRRGRPPKYQTEEERQAARRQQKRASYVASHHVQGRDMAGPSHEQGVPQGQDHGADLLASAVAAITLDDPIAASAAAAAPSPEMTAHRVEEATGASHLPVVPTAASVRAPLHDEGSPIADIGDQVTVTATIKEETKEDNAMLLPSEEVERRGILEAASLAPPSSQTTSHSKGTRPKPKGLVLMRFGPAPDRKVLPSQSDQQRRRQPGPSDIKTAHTDRGKSDGSHGSLPQPKEPSSKMQQQPPGEVQRRDPAGKAADRVPGTMYNLPKPPRPVQPGQAVRRQPQDSIGQAVLDIKEETYIESEGLEDDISGVVDESDNEEALWHRAMIDEPLDGGIPIKSTGVAHGSMAPGERVGSSPSLVGSDIATGRSASPERALSLDGSSNSSTSRSSSIASGSRYSIDSNDKDGSSATHGKEDDDGSSTSSSDTTAEQASSHESICGLLYSLFIWNSEVSSRK